MSKTTNEANKLLEQAPSAKDGLLLMWALCDDRGTVELFSNIADGIELQGDLLCYGVHTTLRLLEIATPDTNTIH